LGALPLRSGNFVDLQTGRAGGFFFLERREGGRVEGGGGGVSVRHLSLESHEASTLMERVSGYEVSANGEKILIVQARPMAAGAEAAPGRGGAQTYSIISAPANAPAGGGAAAGRGAAGATAAASPGTPLNLS